MERIVDSLPCGLAYTLGMESPNSETISAQPLESGVPVPRVIDYALLAKMVVREGKTFYSSALHVGYAESVAARGLKRLISESTPVSEAFKAEWEHLNVGLDKLKPLAVQRLYREIIDNDSPYGMKAIELAGRFKETDWFVRNQDMQLGVFVNLAERPDAESINELDKFKE